ncbi:HDIG domain-containing metalloprotein [Phosphitispora sp. TUW77]|uniref:HDIG domain-containing metalloprotein n=1 Tax=Phosphitispora sp. TUW77 TaxID=3152361 RepID=UPI003AB59738
MQLKFMCHGEIVECARGDDDCHSPMCSRELMLKVMHSLISPQIMPVINRVFEIQELFRLADVVCLGENQLHHVVRMCELAMKVRENCLQELGISRETLLTAVLFHDSGKGEEVDDTGFCDRKVKQIKVPRRLKNYGIPSWVEFNTPLHDHIERGLVIGETYNLKDDILEAIALHHHVKILPETVKLIARGLFLPGVIYEDILHYKPGQYAVSGSTLVQVVAVIDQLCAIERKFEGRVCFTGEPEKMEDELVKDLVIGMTGTSDPRISLLGNSLGGRETVILLDIRSFGAFVSNNSEYKVQSVKKEVLNTIRSVVRVQDFHREKDMVSLVGGDEYAIITKVKEDKIINKMINRIRAAIKNRTGFDVRYGFGIGATIEGNFHTAREMANSQKV